MSFLSKAKVWVTLPLLRNRIMFGQKRSKALFAPMLYLVKKKENRDNYSFECP